MSGREGGSGGGPGFFEACSETVSAGEVFIEDRGAGGFGEVDCGFGG